MSESGNGGTRNGSAVFRDWRVLLAIIGALGAGGAGGNVLSVGAVDETARAEIREHTTDPTLHHAIRSIAQGNAAQIARDRQDDREWKRRMEDKVDRIIETLAMGDR